MEVTVTLVITPAAAAAIKRIIDENNLPEGSGIRIATRPAGNDQGQTQLTLSAETDPMEGDTVIDEEGVVVFVEEEASVYLADKVLRAEVADNRKVSFVLSDD
jgi:iron-sulfur cluster assembly protein